MAGNEDSLEVDDLSQVFSHTRTGLRRKVKPQLSVSQIADHLQYIYLTSSREIVLHDEIPKLVGSEVTVMGELRLCDGMGLEVSRLVWKDDRCGLRLCVGSAPSLKGS